MWWQMEAGICELSQPVQDSLFWHKASTVGVKQLEISPSTPIHSPCLSLSWDIRSRLSPTPGANGFLIQFWFELSSRSGKYSLKYPCRCDWISGEIVPGSAPDDRSAWWSCGNISVTPSLGLVDHRAIFFVKACTLSFTCSTSYAPACSYSGPFRCWNMSDMYASFRSHEASEKWPASWLFSEERNSPISLRSSKTRFSTAPRESQWSSNPSNLCPSRYTK